MYDLLMRTSTERKIINYGLERLTTPVNEYSLKQNIYTTTLCFICKTLRFQTNRNRLPNSQQ